MKLDRKALLKGCKQPEFLEQLLQQADWVLRTSLASNWSLFMPALIKEEAIKVMASLNDIHWESNGGFPNAERTRMCCIHKNATPSSSLTPVPITGLRIEANFLFDKPRPEEIRKALELIGVNPQELGDIWIVNDRGAEGICTPEAAKVLDQSFCLVREVKIHCEAIKINQLRLPIQRLRKRFTTVEASLRIDAIASAGFGLSRAKIITQIKKGGLRLNWSPIKQASKQLVVGDRIQHEDRGSLEILSLELTNRQRWRVELLRS